MKCKKYIESLSSMEDDFDEGLLSQLREEPPEELHGHIMKSIGREKRKRIFLNYRTYVPAIAAVFIFAIVLKGINGDYDINSFIKNKMAEKYGTTNLANVDKEGEKNDIVNQDNLKKEAVDSSSTSKKANDGENTPIAASAQKDIQSKDGRASRSANKSENKNTASADTRGVTPHKVTLDEYASKKSGNKNTNTATGETSTGNEGINNGNVTSNPGPEILEKNKKVLSWITEFNAVATEKNDTYRIAIYEYDRLQNKIMNEGIENSVLTELERNGQYVTFRLNIR